jgi:hypothetical protein
MKGHVAKDHASVDLATAAGDDQPSAAVAEREYGAPSVGGVPAPEEAVLGRHLWARAYFCCRSGNVTDDVFAKYNAEQDVDQDGHFRVDG